MPVIPGIERLFASSRLHGRRIGLVCNPASVDGQLRHVAERCLADPALSVGALFGPQHGFHSDLQDNMIETPHATDQARRVPIYSLYSDTREPSPAMLEGLDVLVIDLQDVGTRVYTFVYTMANCLRAAARHRLPVIVCDRPNPIDGVTVEGPMLVPGFESFVGQFPIPMRHGMTIGELARLFNEQFGIGAKLEVVAMDGWHRTDYFDATGQAWVLPSPNLPTLEAAVVYPGTVLFEGTLVSEGRGTTRPFELIGAPWVTDPDTFADALNAQGLPGVHFRAHTFEPTFQKHARVPCGGVQVHVIDRGVFRPVETGVVLIDAFRRADPAAFAWREPPYEYEYVMPPIDILSGSDHLRTGLEAGVPPRDLAAEWASAVAAFATTRKRYLIYPS